MDSVKVGKLQAFERELGPWFPGDDPRDVLLDMHRMDRVESSGIAVGDVAEYLARVTA